MANQAKKKKSGLSALFSNDAREKTRASRSTAQEESRASRAADRAISKAKGEASVKAPDTVQVYGKTITLTDAQKKQYESSQAKTKAAKAKTKKKSYATGGMSEEKAREYRTKITDTKAAERVKAPSYAETKAARKAEKEKQRRYYSSQSDLDGLSADDARNEKRQARYKAKIDELEKERERLQAAEDAYAPNAEQETFGAEAREYSKSFGKKAKDATDRALGYLLEQVDEDGKRTAYGEGEQADDEGPDHLENDDDEEETLDDFPWGKEKEKKELSDEERAALQRELDEIDAAEGDSRKYNQMLSQLQNLENQDKSKWTDAEWENYYQLNSNFDRLYGGDRKDEIEQLLGKNVKSSIFDPVIDRILGVDRTKVTGEKTNWLQLIKGIAVKGANQWNALNWKSVNFFFGGAAEDLHALGAETLNDVVELLNLIPGVDLNYVDPNSQNLVEFGYNDAVTGEKQANEKYAANANSSRAAQIVDTFGTSTIAAIPMALEAWLLGPTLASKAGELTTAGLSYFSGLQSAKGIEAASMMAREGLTKLFKNPQFWTSYLQVAGDGYENALESGMNGVDASIYGLVNGFFNAVVEIGGADETLGGFQNFPMRLQQMGGKNAVVEWFKDNVLGEAMEEVVQGSTERGLLQAAQGDSAAEMFSTDPNNTRAAFNPYTAGQEAVGGGVVGGILGGGQAGLQAITDSGTGTPRSTIDMIDDEALAQGVDLDDESVERIFNYIKNVGGNISEEEKKIVKSLAEKGKIWNGIFQKNKQNAEPEDASFGRVPGQAAPGVTKPGSQVTNQTTDSGTSAVDPKDFARQVVEEQAEEEQGPYKVKPVRREAAVEKPGVKKGLTNEETDSETGGSEVHFNEETKEEQGPYKVKPERRTSGEERAERQAPEGLREQAEEETEEEAETETEEELEEEPEEESEEENEEEETEENTEENTRGNPKVYKDGKHNAVYQVAQNLGVSEQAARSLADGLDIGTVEAPTYASAVREVVQMAQAGYSPAEVMQNSELAQQITPTQFERAYQIGAELKGGEAEVKTKPLQQNAKIKDLEPALASLGEYAEEAAAAYEPGQDVGTYAAAMTRAIGLYAAQGMDFMNAWQQAKKTGGVLGILTANQRKVVRDIGKKMQAQKKAEAAKKAQQRKETREKARAKGAKHQEGKVTYAKGTGTVGGVRYHAVDQSKLTKTQKATARVAEVIARVTGLDVRIAEFEARGNKATGGEYIRGAGGVLFLNINAKFDGKNIAIGSMCHELVHFLQEYSDEALELKQAILEDFARNPENYENIFDERLRVQPKLTPDDITDEMMANALQNMLLHEETVKQMIKEHRSLMEKIRDFFFNLMDDIKAAFSEIDFHGDFTLYKEVQAVEDDMDRLREIFNRAFASAVENLQAEKAVGREAGRTASQQQVFEEEVTSTEVGDIDIKDYEAAKGTDGNPLFQVYAFEHDEPEYREMLTKWGGMSKTQVDDLFKLVDHAMEIIKGHLEELDYAWETDIDDRSFQPVKQNSDKLYKVSQDFSTLCRKRILQGIISGQLSASLQRGLTKEEGIAVRDALMAIQEEGKQIEVACALCYVESARMRSQKAIQQFLNDPGAAIQNYYAGKSGSEATKAAEMAEREKIWKEYGESLIRGKGDDETMYDIRDPKTATMAKIPTNLKKRIQDAKNAAKKTIPLTAEQQRTVELAKSLPVTAFTTPEGLQELAKNSDTRDIFNAFVLKVSAASKSKGIENDTWWRAGDSKAIGDALIQQMNAENGLRTQSWSDFQVKHLMDYIAATIELSTRGAQQHAYTKVLDYVELMGNTGVMINMSLIPTREFSGTLEYDDVEGFKYKDAMRMREKFPDTAGTICIGMDDEQVRQLLASTDIDYVIPYHQSGMSKATRAAMHIPAWKDFQNYQGEKKLSRAEAKANAEKYGVQLLSEDDPLWHESPNFSDWYDLGKARQTAKKYGKTSEYGVMSGGYAAMQEAAENYKRICAERGLAPKFSYGKADFSNEANYWKLLIDRKMVNNKTGEIIEQKAIKPIFDFDTVQRILDDELERYGTVKADQEEAIERVTQAFLSGKVKGGMSSEDIAEAMKKPVDNVPIVNITENAAQMQVFDDKAESVQDAALEDNEPAVAETNVQFSLWEGEPPKKTQYGFKLMTVKKVGDQWLPTAMFIDRANPYEFGQWYKADSPKLENLINLEPGYSYLIDENDNADMETRRPFKKTTRVNKKGQKQTSYSQLPSVGDIDRATLDGKRWMLVDRYADGGVNIQNLGVNGSGSVSKFALRPGIHAVDIPSMAHIGAVDNENGGKKRRTNERWFLIEYPVDVDYNQEAYSHESKDIRDHLPTGGWYSYQTNSGAEARQHWFITGGMKIVGAVSEADVRKYAKDRGFEQDLQWRDGKVYSEDDAIDLDEYIRTTTAQPTPSKDEMRKRIESGAQFQTFIGYDEETGKGIYESNFPENYPAAEKARHVVDLVQNVFSKKPIELVVYNEDGTSEVIEAQFDPDFDESGNRQTDLGKLAYGNWKGNKREKRVTLNLADDYYQILQEAEYLGSGENYENPSAINKDVEIWHYFVNHILYKEMGKNEKTPYSVYIDVKKKPDGHYVYTFYALEDKNDGQPTPQRFAATVNSPGAGTADGLPTDMVSDTGEDVKTLKQTWDEGPVYNNRALVSEETVDKWLTGGWFGSNTNPNYAQAYIAYMRPDQYLRLSTIYDEGRIQQESEGRTMDWVKDASDGQPIQLKIDTAEGKVYDHEGRHRMVVLSRNGVRHVPVLLFDMDTKYTKEPLAELKLEGQNFNGMRNYATTTVEDLVPLNKAHREEILEKFSKKTSFEKISEKYDQYQTFQFQQWDNSGEDTASEKKGRQIAYARLQSENAILKDAVKSLKKLSGKQATTLANIQKQLQLTKTPETRLSDARKLARAIVRENNSEADVEHVAERIKALGDYLLNTETGKISEETLKGRARAIANEVLEGATENVTLEEETMEVNPFDAYMGEAVEDLANRITMDAMSGLLRETAPTKADKAKARTQALKDRIQNLRDEQKLSQREAASLYQTIYDLSVQLDKAESRYRTLRTEADYRAAQIRAEGTARAAEIYARERARANGLLKAQRETYQRMAKQAKELRENSAQAAKYRKEIEKKVKDLQDMININSDEEHVPAVLRAPLGDFLESIDLSSKSLLNKDISTKADEKRHASFLRMLEALENQQRYIDGDANVQEDLGGYIDISQENLQFLRDTASLIYTSMQQGQTYTINRMNAGQLKQLSQFLSNLKTAINNMNDFMANARYESVKEAASADVDYMNSLGSVSEKASGGIRKFLSWENGVPYYIFKRFGAGGQAIFDGFTRGWEKMARNAKEIIDFTEDAYTDKEVKAWKKQTHDFTLSDGSKITMTTGQIMEFSQLLGREQALKHIGKGGVVIGEIKTKKGEIVNVKQYHFTDEDIQKIVGTLTPRQLEVAKKLQKFMADKGGEWGNEVSMRRFGYNFYTEGEHYYPIRTVDTDRPMADTDAQKNSMFRLLNLSASKSLNPKASNALVVNDIFDTFSDHMADMAKLNGMGLPILDAIKWFNFKERIDRGDGTYDTRTIQAAMKQAFGGNAGHYFRTLMKDINGQTESGDRGTGFLGGIVGRYKASSVGANLRVAMLQGTSYVRAETMLKKRYLTGAFFHRNAYKEAMKYSGTAIWKSLGYYDTDISRSMRSQIQHDETTKDKVVERSMRKAEKGDQKTWGRLWVACKMQTRAETGLTGEELNKKTADLFREVIYSSQVMDSTLTRSEIMRSKSLQNKIMSAFMAEPTLSYNILMDAFVQNNLDKRAGKKNTLQQAGRLKKAFMVYINTAAAAAVIESLIDAMRDDDDEEYWDKFFQAFFGEDDNGNVAVNYSGNFVQDLSILGKIPIVKDMINKAQGYSSGNILFAGFDNLWNSIKIWRETGQLLNGTLKEPTKITNYGNMTTWGKIYKSLQALSQVFGVPVSNQVRDTVAIWNTFVADEILGDPEMKIRTYDSKKDQTYRESVAPTGVTKAQYNTILDRADADGNKSVTQAELADTLQRAIKAGYVTEKQAKAIWSSRFEKSWEEGLKAAEKAKEEAEYEASHPGYTAFKNTAPVYSTKKQDAYKRYQKYVAPYGISIDTYTDILNEADTGNNSVTQDELGKTLRKKIRHGEITYEEAEAIWGTLWHGSRSKTYKKWARSN